MQVCTSLQTLCQHSTTHTHTHTHIRLTALFRGLPGWAGTREAKPIWILLKQETVSGSGISWAICNSAPRSRQITTPATHPSVFYRPDALPAAQPTPTWVISCTEICKWLLISCVWTSFIPKVLFCVCACFCRMSECLVIRVCMHLYGMWR